MESPVSYVSGGTWVSPVSGSWASPHNWSTGPTSVPAGGTIVFPAPPGGPITVTLDGPEAADDLVFDASGSAGYTIVSGLPGSTLTLGAYGNTPSISVLAGSHAVTAAIALNGYLTVNVASGASLQLSGAINAGNFGTAALNFNGPGLLVLSGDDALTGAANTSGGTLQLPGGQLSAASEYITGAAGAWMANSGGANAVAGDLYLGYGAAGQSGAYCLSGSGQLWAASEILGSYSGSGCITQSGGTNAAGGLCPGAIRGLVRTI